MAVLPSDSVPVVASSNGFAAVANYQLQVSQLQKRIPELQKILTDVETKLANLLANPVILHAVK